MRIGVTELLLVLIVALLVLGPDKLPKYARKLGAALAEIRKASDEATREIRENVVEPLEEAQRPLREAMEPVEDLNRAVRENLNDVRTSLENIGKESPRKASAPEAAATSGTETVPGAVTPDAAPDTATPSDAATSAPDTVTPRDAVTDTPPEINL